MYVIYPIGYWYKYICYIFDKFLVKNLTVIKYF